MSVGFLSTPRKERRIVYNVLPTNTGWRIQALIPDRTSADDRIKVVDWFHAYRAEIHKQSPYWLTFFHVDDRGYVMDIIKASGPNDLVSRAVNAGLLGQQMEFDFGYTR